ncbi:MAG TPA: gluconate 2-dehydrogenase subunit 3 family protein [Bacteroidales bacterium]|jgi:gluconate 2-dehydrogenase gamma chain|nr:gluconate 2-dehydrogenase subunit 3 family protein [Bacteroidales bacterium]|tara:strand:+ start:280 stop:912 length:633 start_codon:yes stop_codon:yes gene_type:complete
MAKENRKYKLKHIPDSIRDSQTWQLSRKKFINGVLLGGIAANFPSISLLGKNINKTEKLSANQLSIIVSVQKILFPSDDNGPGAYDVMSDKYLLWVISDVRMDPEEIEYIINGADWVDETAEENFLKSYNKLSQSEKETLIADISIEPWGKSWLGVILTFIFEALLSDPQYAGNPEAIGWDWLKHNPGYPRPTKPLIYPEILATVSKNTN